MSNKKTSGFTKVVGVLFAGIVAVMVFGSMQPKAPEAPKSAAELKGEKQWQHAVTVARAIKKDMRDPDSLQFDTAFIVYETGTVCFQYRAKNGFGGIGKAGLIAPAGGNFLNDKAPGFVEAWNKQCAGNDGRDVAKRLKYAL